MGDPLFDTSDVLCFRTHNLSGTAVVLLHAQTLEGSRYATAWLGVGAQPGYHDIRQAPDLARAIRVFIARWRSGPAADCDLSQAG